MDLPEYTFVDRVVSENTVVTGVKVKSGKFAGMIFTSNPSVEFKHLPDGRLDMNFQYVIQVPPADVITLEDAESLRNTVGDIILDIIYKNLDKEDANRDIDFKRTNEGP